MSCDTGVTIKVNKAEKVAYELEIMKTIEDGLKEGQEKIDISKFKCSYDVIGEVIFLVALDSPLYSSCLVRYKTISWLGSYVQYIIPDYANMNIINCIDIITNEIVANINSNMSDLDKVIWINDYICSNYEYDVSLTKSGIYGMLETKKGTCRAYTQLFKLLADKAELNASIAISYNMRHAWNLVQVDGLWYNIDVTWNDQIQSYCYLLSDEAMIVFHGEAREALNTIQFFNCISERYDWQNLSKKKNENNLSRGKRR
jgi:hypothetical protein